MIIESSLNKVIRPVAAIKSLRFALLGVNDRANPIHSSGLDIKLEDRDILDCYAVLAWWH